MEQKIAEDRGMKFKKLQAYDADFKEAKEHLSVAEDGLKIAAEKLAAAERHRGTSEAADDLYEREWETYVRVKAVCDGMYRLCEFMDKERQKMHEKFAKESVEENNRSPQYAPQKLFKQFDDLPKGDEQKGM